MSALSIPVGTQAPDTIAVSVIIPLHNEERYIASCLDSVLATDFPADRFEVLIVDGRSTDQSCEIVREYAERHPQVKLLDNPEKIVPVAMNIGIRQARGRYIVRMDAHSEYPADYISACVSELERTGVEMVGGSMTTRPGSATTIGQAIALMATHKFGVGNSGFRIGWADRYVDTVPFGAFRREVFDRIGMFRESLVRHQDYEMASRIRATGGKIFLSSKIRLTYYNVPTLAKFMRQAYANGLWLGRSWICFPATLSLRHCVPLAFVSVLLTCAIVGLWFHPALQVAGVVLAAYALAAIISAVQISAKSGWKFMLIMPWLFFMYHFVYGVATIPGLATFGRALQRPRTTLPKFSSAPGAGLQLARIKDKE